MFCLRFLALGLAIEVLPAAAGVADLWSHRQQAQEPISKLGDCQTTTTNTKTNEFAVTPDDIIKANRDGFFFENPETDCKYVSQPYIYKAFKTLETDLSRLFTLINKDVHFQIVGHHPGAGIYHDLMHFYVNALRRVSITASEHPDAFRVNPMGIHGGCDEEWSVQEMNFKGTANSGLDFDIVNVWVTRWSQEEQMIQVRTYIDSTRVSQMLHENEIWWNATRYTDHHEFEPGPAGMPNLTELEQLMPEKDRPQRSGLKV